MTCREKKRANRTAKAASTSAPATPRRLWKLCNSRRTFLSSAMRSGLQRTVLVHAFGSSLRQEQEERNGGPQRGRRQASGEIHRPREYAACREAHAEHQDLREKQQHQHVRRLPPLGEPQDAPVQRDRAEGEKGV